MVVDLDGVLPLPAGSAEAVAGAATTWRQVTGRLGDAVILRTGPADLARSWSGAAAAAAQGDAEVAAAACRLIGAALGGAVAGLESCAVALRSARAAVDGLRLEWSAAQARHRAAQGSGDLAARVEADRAWAAERARLLGRHRATMTALEQAQLAAAGVVAACCTDLLAALGARRPEQVGAALLARLPHTGGELVTRAVVAAGGSLDGLDVESAAVLYALADEVTDPVVASALLTALPPDRLMDVTLRLVRAREAAATGLPPDPARRARAQRALQILGVALATAADPAAAHGVDDATARRLAGWRGRWLGALAASAGRDHGFPDRPAVLGADLQATLLAASRAAISTISPGRDYAATVGPAIVAADAARRPWSPPAVEAGYQPVRPPEPPEDAVASLLTSLRGDPGAAQALLLAPLGDRRVVDRLVVRSVLDQPPRTGHLDELTQVLRECATSRGRDGAEVASLFLDAVTRLQQVLPGLDPNEALALHRSLARLAPVTGELLARHVDAIDVVLLAPTGTAGQDAVPVRRADDGWTVVLRDPATLAALAELTGRDRVDPHHPGPLPTPAHARLLAALVERGGVEVADRLAAGDDAGARAAVLRLGEALGLVTTAGLSGSVDPAVRRDEANARIRQGLEQILGRAEGKATSAVGRALGPGPSGVSRLTPGAVRAITALLEALLPRAVDAGLDRVVPTDTAQQVAGDADAAGRGSQAQLRVALFDLVSATGSWPAAATPEQWAHDHPGRPGFTGSDGRPLPWEELDGAQRAAFLEWAGTIPAYAGLAADLRAALAAGADRARGP